MSVAPEIARLAAAIVLHPARPAGRTTAGPPAGPQDTHAAQAGAGGLTLGTLARELRMIAASPERWWGLVQFNPDRSVRIEVEDRPEYGAWLVIMPPGDTGQDCDCDVATIITGEATEGDPAGPVLRPGPTRVHGRRHRRQGRGAGYSISLHARAHRPADHRPADHQPENSRNRNLGVLG